MNNSYNTMDPRLRGDDRKATRPLATIDLNAITHNYRFLQHQCGNVPVAAVLKANAYGLGTIPIAKTVYAAGCRRFYVAHYEEALELRSVLPDVTLSVFHGVPSGAEDDALEKNITPIINDLGALERMRDVAKKLDKPIAITLHRDTGMNRLGFGTAEWNTLTHSPELLAGLNVTTIMSHLACPETPAHPMNEQQHATFINAAKHFPAAQKSLCNSYGIFLGPHMHYNEVRSGRALSGIIQQPELKSALSIHAPIVQLRLIDSDGAVGYGATQSVKKDMRMAILAYGYADGLQRAFSNNDQDQQHHFYIHGYAVPLVGRVSMDLSVVDVSQVPEHLIHVGGMVEIAGPHQSLDALARQIGSIDYEVMTQMGNRVERRYTFLSSPPPGEVAKT